MTTTDFNPIDRWVIRIAALIFAAAVLLIFDENILFKIGPSGSTGPPIAQAQRVSRDVRRKYRGQFSWFSIGEKADIFASDSIFTGNGSGADVRFRDGSGLSIGPASLVTFDNSSGQPVVDIQMGTVSGSIAPHHTFVFRSHGKVAKVEGDRAQVRVSVDQTGDVNVAVESGKAELETEGRKTPLASGKPLRLADAEISPEAAPMPQPAALKPTPLPEPKRKPRPKPRPAPQLKPKPRADVAESSDESVLWTKKNTYVQEGSVFFLAGVAGKTSEEARKKAQDLVLQEVRDYLHLTDIHGLVLSPRMGYEEKVGKTVRLYSVFSVPLKDLRDFKASRQAK